MNLTWQFVTSDPQLNALLEFNGVKIAPQLNSERGHWFMFALL